MSDTRKHSFSCRRVVAAVVVGSVFQSARAAESIGFWSSLTQHPGEYWWVYVIAAVVVVPSSYFLVRKIAERLRWIHFRKEFLAEKAGLEQARQQAEEEYRATGGGPARTYAAQGRRLPEAGKPDE